MLKQDIQLGIYKYQCELYKYHADNVNTRLKFSIMLNYTMMNLYPVVTDILFFPSDEFDTDTVSSDFAFPVTLNSVQNNGYSCDYTEFNPDVASLSNEIYPLIDGAESDVSIPCDLIKIYHPSIKKNMDAVIHVHSYINNINFHFLCKPYNKCKKGGDKTFTDSNNVYSEYIYFNIPNVEELINQENNIFYKQFGKKIDFTNFFKQFEFKLVEATEYVDEHYEPYYRGKIDIKSIPINITVYPYSGINTATNRYNFISGLTPNTDSFETKYGFSLSNKIAFSAGIKGDDDEYLIQPGTPVLHGTLVYPKILKADGTYMSCDEAYRYVNNLTDADITVYKGEKSIDESELNPDEDQSTQVPSYALQETWIYIGASIGEASKLTTHPIKVLTGECPNNLQDEAGNDIIIESEYEVPLTDIFTDWHQMPETLTAQLILADAYLGITYKSNVVIITKEQFKYLVNKNFDDKERIDMKLEDNKILIDKVTCYVNKSESGNEHAMSSNILPKVILKPLFYRTSDISSLSLRNGTVQNVGINLQNYMSKVDSFYIMIDGQRFNEVGRNGVYTIFSISSGQLLTSTGYYDLCDQDGNYITTGTYSIY